MVGSRQNSPVLRDCDHEVAAAGRHRALRENRRPLGRRQKEFTRRGVRQDWFLGMPRSVLTIPNLASTQERKSDESAHIEFLASLFQLKSGAVDLAGFRI